MPLEEPLTVMRQAQYKVCKDFIDQLRNGCPEVTSAIAKYPALVDVVRAMIRSPGARLVNSAKLDNRLLSKNY